MKKIARFIIFYSLIFFILFILSCIFRFLDSWIDSVRVISSNLEHGGALIESAKSALLPTVFLTILFSLSYSARKEISVPTSIFLVLIFSVVFYMGFFFGIERIKANDPVLNMPESITRRAGFIISQLDTDLVFLRGQADSTGSTDFPRVISFPEQPLMYQETSLGPNYTVFSLEFGARNSWLVESILIDINLISREIETRFREEFLSFLIFFTTLFFLLASLRFLLDFSAWPMANLFLAALIFRLILSLNIFLNTSDVKTFLNTFIAGRLPESLVLPAVFCTLSAVILLYTFLSFFARQGRRKND